MKDASDIYEAARKAAGKAGRDLEEGAPFLLKPRQMAGLCLWLGARMAPSCPDDEARAYAGLLEDARAHLEARPGLYGGGGNVATVGASWFGLAELIEFACLRVARMPGATRTATRRAAALAVKLERRRAKDAGEDPAAAGRALTQDLRAEIARLSAELVWGAPVEGVVRREVDELGEAWFLKLEGERYAGLIRPRGRRSRRLEAGYFEVERFLDEA